jgi:hypothetical protein
MTVLTIEGSKVAKRGWFWVVAVVIGGSLVWWKTRPAPPVSLSAWSQVVAIAPAPAGLEWAAVQDHPTISAALGGTDPEQLRAAMREAGIEGLWFPAAPAPSEPSMPLRRRFSAGAIVRGFHGKALTASGLLYVLDDVEWDPAVADRVLGRVAREILEGRAPPALEAFPASLRRAQRVEVLVLLMGARGPRLWRSARSPSIADGVVTAALAARKRWEERAETMGGPLRERLNDLDVHVAFLFDDGTFDRSAITLIDALVKPPHGIAYEQPSRWRYLLPRATQHAATPTDAYKRLFRDNGLPEDSFERRDLRLYRMKMQTVSVDQGSTASNRSAGPSRSAD